MRVLRRSIALAVLCASFAAAAGLDFGGAFEVNTSPTFVAPGCAVCNDANLATGDCSCPPGAALASVAAVVNDCDPGVLFRPGWIGICLPDALSPSASIAGAFQVDDAVPGGVGCRSPNRFTGGCGCPVGFGGLPFRALAPVGFPPDGATPYIGSTITICEAAGAVRVRGRGGAASARARTSHPHACARASQTTPFGGAYQIDDPVPSGEYVGSRAVAA